MQLPSVPIDPPAPCLLPGKALARDELALVVEQIEPSGLAAIYCDLFMRRWGFVATGAERMAEVVELLRCRAQGRSWWPWH